MLKFYLFSFFFLVFISCNKDKLKAPEASFLISNTPTVITTTAQGTNSHKITDIWFYVDGQFKGIYPIGGIMPIVAKGGAKILMYAGIKKNGIADTRIPYDFYKPYEYVQTLEKGKTYNITPTFEYLSSALFPINENFDGIGFQFMSVGDSSYTITKDPSKTYGGSTGSVFMSMGYSKLTAKMKTSSSVSLPLSGTTIYLEMNYKCNQSINVGIIGGGTDERNVITLNPTTDWNKIYISLTDIVSTQPTYLFYDIFISAIKEVDSPQIYIDNVKVITK